MYDGVSTIIVLVGFATLGDDILDFDEILLDFQNGYVEKRFNEQPLIGGEDFDLVAFSLKACTVAFLPWS